MHIIKCFIISFIIILGSGQVRSQGLTSSSDIKKDILQSRLLKLDSVSNSFFNPVENLTNGKLFYPKGDKVNHPYFIENEWKNGKIWYLGKNYDMKMLKYDLFSDYLVNMFLTDSSAYPVYLNKEIIKEFEIIGHHFRYIDVNESQGDEKIIEGYYEVLYDGVTSLLLHHEKSRGLNKLTLETEYPLKVFFYIKHDGKYILIKNKSRFLSFLGSHESEIRSFMKTNSIKFSLKNYGSIIKILSYFDKLPPL